MKIIELRAENVKKIVAVTIKPDGNMVEITGRNGSGKTSVLDAIWWALEGQKNIQAVPIRKGATSAKVRLDLGDLKITRTFSQEKDKETKEPTGDYTTSIVVENAEGARFPSPQSVIDKLLGALSFDPLAFTRMKPAEQFETLKQFVPGVDFGVLDKANENDFRIRTETNKQVKDLRAREAAVVVDEQIAPIPVDEAGIVQEIEDAGRYNAGIETQRVQRQNFRDKLTDERRRLQEKEEEREAMQREIAQLQSKLRALESRIEETRNQIQAQQTYLDDADPIPALINMQPIRDRLVFAKNENRRIEANERAKADKARLATQADDAEKKAADLTRAMDARKKAKADAIAAAKMPVDGIGFGDGAVLLNGVPFEQASDAEQLRASINIAAAMNPKLRVIRVRDGSLLDESALKLLAEFAEASDMQIWLERVDSSGKVGFVMEDGHLVAREERAAS